MNKKKDSNEVVARVEQQIRPARHGKRYYLALFLVFFAIPLYVLLQFFYVDAGGWELFDLFLILALLAIASHGLYREFAARTKLPMWFIVIGVISGICITILTIFIN